MTRARSALSSRARARGFSLIELAVVVVIVGLLLGALLVPLATQIELRQLTGEQRRQLDLRDALIGFAVANRRLPCPAVQRDGLEDATVAGPPANGPCVAATGFLPYQTLGVQATDTWDRLYLYRVNAEFTVASVPGTPAPVPAQLDIQDSSDILVQDRDEAKVLSPPSATPTSEVAAVIVSLGPNGHGATDLNGNVIAVPVAPPTLTDELENLDGDRIFVARARTVSRDVCDDDNAAVTFLCEFDDIVTWVPATLLKLRLVEGGALP